MIAKEQRILNLSGLRFKPSSGSNSAVSVRVRSRSSQIQKEVIEGVETEIALRGLTGLIFLDWCRGRGNPGIFLSRGYFSRSKV